MQLDNHKTSSFSIKSPGLSKDRTISCNSFVAKLAVMSVLFLSLSAIAPPSLSQEANATKKSSLTATTEDKAPELKKIHDETKREKIRRFSVVTAELAMHAMGLIGIRYRYGGDTPDAGLDCSGFVQYVFKQASGTDLPRTSKELHKTGTKVASRDLSLGDLVFFRTVKNTVSHVGIYLGGNRFIHSPSAGGAVRVESMASGYWKSRFAGGRRVIDEQPI